VAVRKDHRVAIGNQASIAPARRFKDQLRRSRVQVMDSKVEV